MNEAIIETATKNTVESEAETKDENKSSAFIRTSKILLESNNTNQVKLNELSNFLDLCSNALNFYVIHFVRYHQLDKLLFVPAKHKNNKIFAQESCSNLTKLNSIFYDLVHDKEKNKDKFSLKLKFYPDEILKINAAPTPAPTSVSTSTLIKNNIETKTILAESDDSDDSDNSLDQEFSSKLSARTLKSVKTQAMGIIRSWYNKFYKVINLVISTETNIKNHIEKILENIVMINEKSSKILFAVLEKKIQSSILISLSLILLIVNC